MKQVYICSTLKNQWNIRFNLVLCEALEAKGINCYLPQRDTDQTSAPEQKFKQNITAIKKSTHLLAVSKNETANWGAEVGFVAGTQTSSIILKQKDRDVQLMVEGIADNLFAVDDFENVSAYVDELIKLLK